MKSIVILGGSFAGLNAAFQLKRSLGKQAEVTVVARDPRFVFIPSLIWVVPGWRKPGQISFDLEPALSRRDITFVHATAQRIDPAGPPSCDGLRRHHLRLPADRHRAPVRLVRSSPASGPPTARPTRSATCRTR